MKETVHPTLQHRGVNQYLTMFYSSKALYEKNKLQMVPKEGMQPKVLIVAEPVLLMDPLPCFSAATLTGPRDYFVRDVVFYFAPGDRKFLPANESSLVGMGMAKQALTQGAVAQQLSKTTLAEGLSQKMTTQVYYDYLVSSVKAMSSDAFLGISTPFYITLFQVQTEIRQNEVIYRVHPELGLSKTASGALVRSSKYLDPVKREPSTLKERIQFLMHERAVRGADSQRSNYFSQYSGRGAFATKERLSICDVLSVAYPLLQEFDVHVLVPSSVAEKLLDFIKMENIQHLSVAFTDSFNSLLNHSSSVFLKHGEVAYPVHGLNAKTYLGSLTAVTSTVIVPADMGVSVDVALTRKRVMIDFRGTELFSYNSKINYEEQWAQNLKKHLSAYNAYDFFIAKVKMATEIFPSFSGYRFFKFHSAHAFDLLMTNMNKIERTVRFYAAYPDETGIVIEDKQDIVESLQAVNPGSWNSQVFSDSRFRTWSFLNKDYGPVDFSLNLYGVFVKSTKADMKNRSRILAEYQQPVDVLIEQFKGTSILAFATASEPNGAALPPPRNDVAAQPVVKIEDDDDDVVYEAPLMGSGEV
jgi:hypothetical protein